MGKAVKKFRKSRGQIPTELEKPGEHSTSAGGFGDAGDSADLLKGLWLDHGSEESVREIFHM